MIRNKITTAFVLGIYALITVATSTSSTGPIDITAKNYSVASNCSNATVTSGQIEVSGDTIVTPSTIDFTNIGLCSPQITIGSDCSGTLAPALTRHCVYSSSNPTGLAVVSTYTCSDNSIPSCVVTLTPY
ncbi:MAG: hypothetical protein ACXVAX_03710 [Pseudobdellovibrio sp.]